MDIQKIFKTAVKYGASDIYITTGIKPTLRINGDLVPIEDHPILSKAMAEEYLGSVMTEQQKKEFAQNLDIDLGLNVPGTGRFRLNIYIQNNGIGGVFRLIPEIVKSLDELNLPSQLKKIVDYKQGIVLVTGPTGQGKSTTLAALINEINAQHDYNIVTIEDPIEFVHQNKKSMINQREIGSHTKSFGAALKASLRESSDVILVGEMRDLETISLALTAAETGHLVLSTLHTSGAAKSVDRIIDAFPPDQQNQIRAQLSESLRCIVWQQLVKKSSGDSRVAALEILFGNSAVSNLIRKGKTYQIGSVMETGMKEGMQTMNNSIKNLLSMGYIDDATANTFLMSLSNIDEEEIV